MAALDSLEKQLDEVFVKNAPFQLPENAKKSIVEFLPWVNLLLGVVSLWAAWVLYDWAQAVNKLADAVNSFAQTFGTTQYVTKTRFTVFVWIALATMAVQGALWILAFPGTKAKKKSGWNLLFLALLVNILYGVVIMFTDFGGFGRLIQALLSSVVGLYFLFQIRSYYLPGGATKVAAKKEETKPVHPAKK